MTISRKLSLPIVLLAAFMSTIQAAVQSSDVILYDPLDGSTFGTLVGAPPPTFVPGLFGRGAQPIRDSISAAIRYAVQPPPSGTILFWIKVVAPIDFYRGSNIGFYGHESGDCDDFYMQMGLSYGLEIAFTHSPGPGSTHALSPLTWQVGEVHHLAVTWGTGLQAQFYLDGVQFSLNGSGAYSPDSCMSPTAPILFTAARENYPDQYSPGPLVFDDFAILNRPLSSSEVVQIVADHRPLFVLQTPLYKICLLYDSTKAANSGATLPIKLQLCDGNGNDRSSSSITVHATSISKVSTAISGDVQDAGNSNPDNDFRFDPALGGTGGYIFNLKTTGLSTGTYNLNFTVTGDSFTYTVPFQVK